MADLERSADLAGSVSSPEEARATHNRASTAWWRSDIREAARLFAEAARLGEHYGVGQLGLSSTAVLCSALCFTGEWDEALQLADEVLDRIEGGRANYFEYHPRTVRARIGLARGDDGEVVLNDARRAVEVARSTMDAQAVIPALSTFSLVSAELGHADHARDAAHEIVAALDDAEPVNVHRIIDAAWAADRLGYGEPLSAFVRGTPSGLPWRTAVLAVLSGEYERAADALAAIGHVDEAYARLLAGERLVAEGHFEDARLQFHATLAAYRPLGATRYVARAEAVLGEISEIPA